MAPKLALSPEHRARELLHGIMLVTQCLKIVGPTAIQRQQWKQRADTSLRKLEALYSNGLDRNFRKARTAIAAGQSAVSLGSVPSPAPSDFATVAYTCARAD